VFDVEDAIYLVRITATFDGRSLADISEEELRRDFRQALSNYAEVDSSRVTISSITPGSIVVNAEVNGFDSAVEAQQLRDILIEAPEDIFNRPNGFDNRRYGIPNISAGVLQEGLVDPTNSSDGGVTNSLSVVTIVIIVAVAIIALGVIALCFWCLWCRKDNTKGNKKNDTDRYQERFEEMKRESDNRPTITTESKGSSRTSGRRKTIAALVLEEQKRREEDGSGSEDFYSNEVLLDLLLGRKPRTRAQVIASRQGTRQTAYSADLGYGTDQLYSNNGTRKTVQQMVIESTVPLPKEEKKKAHWFGSIRLFFEDDIKWGDELGRGNFGKAVLGEIKDGNTGRQRTIVVKIPSHSYGINHELVNELLAMANLPAHKNILQLLGVVTVDENGPKKVCFITDYCSMGSIDKLHDKIDMSSEPEFLRVSLGVAEGLSHLHAKRIIHRDLACRNILMRNDNTVVICDFGLSRIVEAQDDGYTAQGSIFPWAWTSPETLRSGRFDTKSDIWSLGITMWELLTKGQKPYAEYLYRKKFVIQEVSLLFYPSMLNSLRKFLRLKKEN